MKKVDVKKIYLMPREDGTEQEIVIRRSILAECLEDWEKRGWVEDGDSGPGKVP